MNIFVLTGAGVSAESGLGTFRDKAGTGIWARFDPMRLATPEAFALDPVQVHAFYNMRRQNLLHAQPNAAHVALARLETGLAERGGRLFLCTQNIDDLHERAGSRQVTHMHGELLKARCVRCEAVTPWREDLSVDAQCPRCGQPGGLRPDVAWFGEMPMHMDLIYEALSEADLLWLWAPQARSTPPPGSWPRHEQRASARARSTWSRPTTRGCSTKLATGLPARLFPLGLRMS